MPCDQRMESVGATSVPGLTVSHTTSTVSPVGVMLASVRPWHPAAPSKMAAAPAQKRAGRSMEDVLIAITAGITAGERPR